ncbi:enoyl-CoA hydratase/isomerase family protein [Halomonas campisalis]|uniref:Enoyl-CoA hydratase/isomerase family protein n=1 Tax=Billgrantia campisalis TaxID=74661 RepID=A0ABS9P5C6_9GAMM|nr:enoyl-CoA hydratase-related protein [Halomonas campisalis]MCG6656976.1 enoyl-CoA hydratase/isomerase family protein [Halomonas campisalis]MDR5862163.1 enoyl-CoA hydratase-related protein [Halomonas campisalis]
MHLNVITEGLSLQRHPDGLLELVLTRPQVRNALDEATAVALRDHLQAAADDSQVKAVILRGEGGAFCAGADLSAFEGTADSLLSEALARLFEPALNAIMAMDKPVIAAVEGPTAGIGVSYLLASDLVVMGESAFLKLGFIDIGLVPDGGANWHLVHRLGHARAFELTALAPEIDAARCLALGLANRVVAESQASETAREIARQLINQPARALAATKQLLRTAAEASLLDTMALEGRLQDSCRLEPDFRERVQALLHRRR